MRTFLVTGGAGFIGSHIATSLVQREDKVRVLDNLSTGHRIVNGVRHPCSSVKARSAAFPSVAWLCGVCRIRLGRTSLAAW